MNGKFGLWFTHLANIRIGKNIVIQIELYISGLTKHWSANVFNHIRIRNHTIFKDLNRVYLLGFSKLTDVSGHLHDSGVSQSIWHHVWHDYITCFSAGKMSSLRRWFEACSIKLAQSSLGIPHCFWIYRVLNFHDCYKQFNYYSAYRFL